MKEYITSFLRCNRGFTLVELMVVVSILAILAAIVIVSLFSIANSGDNEAKDTEHYNLQTAVYTMMVKAAMFTLDDPGAGYYNGVDEETEVQGVTVTKNGNISYLDDYLIGGKYPLLQSYDIALDGAVTID